MINFVLHLTPTTSYSPQLHCFEANVRMSHNLLLICSVFLSTEKPISNNLSVMISKPSTHILISKHNFPFKGSRTPWGK